MWYYCNLLFVLVLVWYAYDILERNYVETMLVLYQVHCLPDILAQATLKVNATRRVYVQ